MAAHRTSPNHAADSLSEFSVKIVGFAAVPRGLAPITEGCSSINIAAPLSGPLVCHTVLTIIRLCEFPVGALPKEITEL